jgi:hypothetical protein
LLAAEADARAAVEVAAAAGGHTSGSRQISETRKVISVGTQGKPGTAGFRLIGVGTLDGRIGAAQIHGALRTRVKALGPGRVSVDGTEFDAGGSRSFVISLHYTLTNGRTIETGTGRWTGVTGAYTRARGSFKDNDAGPVSGLQTSRINGTISYG